MDLDADTVDRLAALAYARHLPDAELTWDDLDENGREANRDGVRAIPDLMAELGYRVVPRAHAGTDTSSDAGPHAVGTTVEHLSDGEVERAAMGEHERWMRFTRQLGYRYGPSRDEALMTHPDLVPWEELDEPTRDKDRIRVRAIPDLLDVVGLALSPTSRPAG